MNKIKSVLKWIGDRALWLFAAVCVLFCIVDFVGTGCTVLNAGYLIAGYIAILFDILFKIATCLDNIAKKLDNLN